MRKTESQNNINIGQTDKGNYRAEEKERKKIIKNLNMKLSKVLGLTKLFAHAI